jgi:hypothetical protein
MQRIVIVLLVVLTALGIYFMSHASDKKPLISAPSSIIADSISTDLDFRTKAEIALRIESQERDFKELLAMGNQDDEVVKASLARFDELKADVAKARSDLITTGSTDKAFDGWLKHLRWDEVQDLAVQMRSKMKQSDE